MVFTNVPAGYWLNLAIVCFIGCSIGALHLWQTRTPSRRMRAVTPRANASILKPKRAYRTFL